MTLNEAVTCASKHQAKKEATVACNILCCSPFERFPMAMVDDQAKMNMLFSRMVVRAITEERLEEIQEFFDDNPSLHIDEYMPQLADIVLTHVSYELKGANHHVQSPSPDAVSCSSANETLAKRLHFGSNKFRLPHTALSSQIEKQSPRTRRRCSCPSPRTSPLLEMRKQRDAKMSRAKQNAARKQ